MLLTALCRIHNNKLLCTVKWLFCKIIINKRFCGVKVVLMCFWKCNGVCVGCWGMQRLELWCLNEKDTLSLLRWCIIADYSHSLHISSCERKKCLLLQAFCECVWEWVSCVLACAKRVQVKERDRKSLWVCAQHREVRERHFCCAEQAFKTLFVSWTPKKLFTWNTPRVFKQR